MDGILRCSRYSFGPNRLHYCGPDVNAELQAEIEAGATNPNLAGILREFKTLFPYLKLIAEANNIIDPFDASVVEAYWLGNELLERVEKRYLYDFLITDLEIRKKINSRELDWLENKIKAGALPHHSFHVLNLWRQTSDKAESQHPENLSECCVNAGKIISVNGPEITVTTEMPIYLDGKFELSQVQEKKLSRKLEAEYDIEQLQPGQLISFHWGVPCEVITKKQATNLKKYTLQNIKFSNQTI